MTAFTTEKIAVLAPIPSASVRIVTIAKPGDRSRFRAACRTSRIKPSIAGPHDRGQVSHVQTLLPAVGLDDGCRRTVDTVDIVFQGCLRNTNDSPFCPPSLIRASSVPSLFFV